MIKVCSYCKSQFDAISRRNMFCSETCAINSRLGPPDENGCQNWPGASWKGYGIFTFNGQKKRVARTVLSNNLNRHLEDDEETRHICDNPLCCNSDHLIVGSRQDNIDDMTSKSRQVMGSRQSFAKFTEDEVIDIRKSSMSIAKLAAKHDVSYSTIWNIIHRKTWKHI